VLPSTPNQWVPPPGLRTSLKPVAWAEALKDFPNRDEVEYVLQVMSDGAAINFEGERVGSMVTKNLGSVHINPEFVTSYLEAEVTAGRMLGPFEVPPWPHFRTSPVGLVPKDGVSFRLINHLSYGGVESVNGGIEKMECNLGSFDEAIALVKEAGQGAMLLKVDVKAAFRLIPVRQEDVPLLGVKWNDRFYFDMCLPFGLRTSPAIWERFSRLLRWLFATQSGRTTCYTLR
jgi:hypothetical protein